MTSGADTALEHQLRRWYHHWITSIDDRDPHPDTCPTCNKSKLPRSTSDTVCTICSRFKRLTPAPPSFTYCSCVCTCAQAPADEQSDENDSTDEDYRPNSSHSTDSQATDSSDVSYDETQAIASGLSLMELYDLHAEGFSQEEIRRRFPEAVSVHRQMPPRGPEGSGDRPSNDFDLELSEVQCRKCNHLVMREMHAALETGRVQECRGCERPRYRADPSLVLSEVGIDACLCRCDCDFVPDVDMGHPGYLPFLSNSVDWTPRPWLQRWLERQGFCNINSQIQRWQSRIVSGTFLPTFRSIVDRSYITEMETTNDSLLPLGEDRRSNLFPNGVERDPTTGSGLPAALDSVIRSIDEDAFAIRRQHELCRLANSMEDGADVSSLPIDQQNAMFRYRLLTNDNPAAVRHGPTNFRVWLIDHEDDFTDNESICTVDDLDIDRNEYLASMTREERGAHRRRHITRRFTDMARQGGYYTTASIIHAAARIEFDLESFLHSRVGGSDPQAVFHGSLLENGTPPYEASDLGQDAEVDDLDNNGDDAYLDALLDEEDTESVYTDSDDEGTHDTRWVNYEGFNFTLPRLQEVAARLRQNQIEVPDHMQRLITQMQQMETSTAESLTQNDQQQSRTNHPSNDLDHDMSEAGSDCDSLAEDDDMSDADVEDTPAVANA